MDANTGRRIRIAVLDDFQGVALASGPWSRLRDRADITVFRDRPATPSDLIDRLRPFEVVCLMRERTALPRDVLEPLQDLRLIVTTGMWNASIDMAQAARMGIVVCGTSSVGSGTPELTWLLILALARRLPAELASVRTGGWQTGVGTDLAGSTLGILGLGRIGSRVAAVAGAFGMRVLAWSHRLTAEAARQAGATLVPLQDLLRQSDFVTIHLKLSERSQGLIGAPELALMKPSACLVNTSRGPIVDEAALLDALRSGRIAGAGLDVFDVEPLPAEHPFRRLDTVVATPHLGYVTRSTYAAFFGETVENIEAWLNGAPIRVLAPPDGSLLPGLPG